MTTAAPAPPFGRSLSVDMLRLCLAVMVVFLHCNPASDISPLLAFVTGNGLFRIAVPAFFMLSGYFYAPAVRSGNALAYIRRIVLLYALWMLLYLPLWHGAFHWDRPMRSLLLLGFGWWHLWYLIALAFCAAVTLLLRDRPARQLIALATGLFLTGVAIMYATALRWSGLDGWFPGPQVWLYRNGLFLGLPFFLAGFLVRRDGFERRFPAPVLWTAALCGIALLMLESVAVRSYAPRVIGLDNPLMLALAAPAVVLLALRGTRSTPGRLIGTLANGTFYLHVAVLVPLMQATNLPRTAIALLTLAATAGMSLVILRTRLDRHIM